MSDSPQLPEVNVATLPREKDETSTRRIPPYNVILENDDFHSFPFVVEVLCKALGLSAERSFQFTELAHRTGQAVVWTGTKELAELKTEQIQSFHEIRADGSKLGPLGVSIEPAPG